MTIKKYILSLYFSFFVICFVFPINNGDTWSFRVLGYYLYMNGDKDYEYFIPPDSFDMAALFSDSDISAHSIGTVNELNITEIKFLNNAIINIVRKNKKVELGAIWDVSLVINNASVKENEMEVIRKEQEKLGNYLFYIWDPIGIKIYLLKYVNSNRKEEELAFTEDSEGNLYTMISLKRDDFMAIYTIYKVDLNGSILPTKATDIEYMDRLTKGWK